MKWSALCLSICDFISALWPLVRFFFFRYYFGHAKFSDNSDSRPYWHTAKPALCKVINRLPCVSETINQTSVKFSIRSVFYSWHLTLILVFDHTDPLQSKLHIMRRWIPEVLYKPFYRYGYISTFYSIVLLKYVNLSSVI